MSQKKMWKKYPLNCPYCDEPAYPKRYANRLVTPLAIYTTRECPLGHTFVSVEETPENPEEVEQEMRDYKSMSAEERINNDEIYI